MNRTVVATIVGTTLGFLAARWGKKELNRYKHVGKILDFKHTSQKSHGL